MIVRFFAALAALPLLTMEVPAYAQIVADPEMVANVMRDAGYRAEVDELESGTPFIQSSSGGLPFRVFFYGCDDGGQNCKTIQLYAGFITDNSPTLTEMNAYNRDNRFGRVYIDNEDDPVIEMDIDLEDGGMSAALLEDNLEYWAYIMGRFSEFAFSKD